MKHFIGEISYKNPEEHMSTSKVRGNFELE